MYTNIPKVILHSKNANRALKCQKYTITPENNILVPAEFVSRLLVIARLKLD